MEKQPTAITKMLSIKKFAVWYVIFHRMSGTFLEYYHSKDQALISLKAANAAPELLQTLIDLDKCGHLGLDNHAKIREAIKKATD